MPRSLPRPAGWTPQRVRASQEQGVPGADPESQEGAWVPALKPAGPWRPGSRLHWVTVLGPSYPGDLPLTQSPGPASGHFRGNSRQGCREPRRAVLSNETSTQPGATQSSKGSSRSPPAAARALRPGSGYPGAGPKPHRSLVSGPTAPCGPQRLAEVRPPLTLSQGLCLVVSPLQDREQGPW